MLRNRGVNVTERRIKHDVLRAYEYDIFDARPRWRRLHEAGCQANVYRQPRYCTVPRPVYYNTGRSSLSSVGVKRVYLPDEEWGDSADSTLYVRNTYNMGSYYPNEAYFCGDRPYRRDFRYPEDHYSRRPSRMYVDDNDYYPTRSCSKYTSRKLARTVTRKLSPIFPCECTTKSYIKEKKNINEDIEKSKTQNNLSREAKKLSLDIYKILSLLSKADRDDDDEPFSSVSLLQNIHNLDCESNNSVAQLITQRVNICPKMERRKQYDPLTNLKTTSGVRSKLEALVKALKEYEAEKALNDDSFDYDNMPKYNDGIPSDPPSLEVRSFLDGKDSHSSTNVIGGGKRKNIVLQTEDPKTSNKSVCGNTKKGDSNAERKSLRSRMSWRKKESSGIKMRRDSAREKLTDKNTERKKSFFSKTKSKSRIKSRDEIVESEHKLPEPEKNYRTKQGQPNNKAGLMITIGGNPQRKKQPPPEKHKDKMPKTWIRKFLEDKRESKNNNIRVRWNNRAFYAKSSSTVFELVNNVYKQMGINRNSKSDEITTSKNKKALRKTTHKQSKTKVPKSSKKGKYNQKVDAYMMPEIIAPGPVFMPANVKKGHTKKYTQQLVSNLLCKSKPCLSAINTNFYNGTSNASDLSSYCLEVQLPKSILEPVLAIKVSSSDRRVEEIDEYIVIQSDSSDKTLIYEDMSGTSAEKELEFNDSFSVKANEDVNLRTVFQMSNSICYPKKSEDTEIDVTLRELESEPNRSTDEEISQSHRKSHCSLADQFIQEEYRNLMPISIDSLQWSADCEDLDKVSTTHDEEVSVTNTGNTTATTKHDSTENKTIHKVAPKDSKMYRRRKFRDSFFRWKDRTKGTLSESIVGDAKTHVVSVLWRLFRMLRKDCSVKTKIKPPPQDISLVEPPGTVSVPECSYKSQPVHLPQSSLQSQKPRSKYEPLRLAQLASSALKAQKEAKINTSLKSKVYMEFANLAQDVFQAELEMAKLSLAVNPAQTAEEAENKLRLCEPLRVSSHAESVQSTVLEKLQEKSNLKSISSRPIRLVRSFHFNIPTEKIKPRAVRSVLLPQQQVYHLQLLSQFILSVRPVYNLQEGIEQTVKVVELQPPNDTQLMSVSPTCALQDLDQKVADQNEAADGTAKDREKNTISSEVSQQDETVKVQTCNCGEPKCRDKKSRDIKTKTTDQFTYVQQMPKTENNIFPSKISHINVERDVSRLNLEVVEVTQCDKITKIFIKKRNSIKVNKQTPINVIFQEPVVNNVEVIKQSTKRKRRKNIKLCINYANINAKKAEHSERLIGTVLEDQLPEKDVDNTQVVATEYTDLEHYSTDNAEGIQRCSLQRSLWQDILINPCSQIDDMCGGNMQPIYFKKPTSTSSINATELNDSVTADKNSSIDNNLCNIATKDFVNVMLKTPDIEMKRMLNGNTYNMGSYYPNEAYFCGDRPYRRDFRYPEDHYSRRPSTMYVDDNDYYPTRSCSKYTSRKLARTVTRKLSPIFPCECTTKSYIKEKKNINEDIEKSKTQNNLSKEAKKLSLDIYKILSLLSKADRDDDDEPFSSVSLLQNIHNLDCESNNSVAQLITQRVNICPTMERRKQYDPLTNLKTTSGVRSKLEALVKALKEYEAEKALNDDSFDYDNMPKYNDGIPSDPPSLEVRSFLDGKDSHSSTNVIGGGKRKNIVLQTEDTKTSNKSVCGNTKKGDSHAERKSLRSRMSWRKKESSGIKMRRDSAREKLTDKNTERKKSFLSKTKSKSRIKSRDEIVESEHKLPEPEKNYRTKQGQPNNKAGLMITIGGNPQRKKQPPPEKHKDKMPKTWIRKFLEDKRESKNNNIRVRWNNRAFYAKSSSTVFELVNNVYKQMGINRNSKSDEITTSKNKKALRKTTHKQSKTKVPKSSKKGKYNQKVDAYMMPEIIAPGPVFMPANVKKGHTKKYTQQLVSNLLCKSKHCLSAINTNFYNGTSNASDLSSYCLEVQLPKSILEPVLAIKVSSSDRRVEEIDEYIVIQSDSSDKTLIYEDMSGTSAEKELEFNDSFSVKANEDVNLRTVFQMSNSICYPKKSEDTEIDVTLRELESEPNRSTDEEISQSHRKSHCSLADQFIQEEYRNLMPISIDSLQWSADCEDLDKVSTTHDEEVSVTNTGNTTATTKHDSTENKTIHKVAPKDSKMYRRRKFRDSFFRWKDRTKGTLSESIVGDAKTHVVSVLWRLFRMLRKDCSVKTKIKPPPQDISLVEPPGTVSVPECSYKSQPVHLPQSSLQSQKPRSKYEPLRLAQLASSALKAQKEAKINTSLKSKVYMEFANLAQDVFQAELEMAKLSLAVNPAQTAEEAENKLRLCEPLRVSSHAESVQSTVLEKLQEKSNLKSISSRPIRLVRSFHFNIPTEKIKPRAVRSVLLPQQQVYHLQLLSQFILSVRPVYNLQEGIEQTVKVVELQPPNDTQLMSVSPTCALQDLDQKVADQNEAADGTAKDREKNTISSEVSQQDETVKVQTCNCGEPKCRDKKSRDIKTKTTDQFTYVQQMPKTENNIFPSKISHINVERDVSRLNLEVVEVTQCDKITKIFIKKRNSIKVNKQTPINVIFQEPVVNNVEVIKQSTKRKRRKNIKLCINYANINAKKAEHSERLIGTVLEDQLPEKDVDNTQVVATEYTDLEHYSTDNAEGIQRCSLQRSLWQDILINPCSQIDDMCGGNMQPIYFKKPTSTSSINATELNDSVAADKNSSIDNNLCNIATKDFVNTMLKTPDIEMKRMLNGTMTLNVSAFVEMALMRELASEHTETYSSIREQLERRKKIVNILSEINMRYMKNDNLRDQATTTAGFIFGESDVGSCQCPLCILLGKNRNSRHADVDIPIRINSRIKENCGASYNAPHLVKSVTLESLELKDEFNNSDTFINKDGTEIGATIMKSLPKSSKRKTKKIQAIEPLFLYSVKREKPSNNNFTNKRKTKKHNNGPISEDRYQGHSILDDMDPCKSDTTFTEFKVLFKNGDLQKVKKNTLYSEVNKSDILQSCKIKKAVLQIYNEGTVENEDFVVAKVPKYLRL